MKLFSFWRSLATYRVRIALNENTRHYEAMLRAVWISSMSDESSSLAPELFIRF